MVLVSEVRHPRSLDFRNERKVVVLREQGWPWCAIAQEVRNLQGKPAGRWAVTQAYKQFSKTLGRRRFHYDRCGLQPQKVTREVRRFLRRKVHELRNRCVCTSTTLQRALAQGMGVHLESSTVRKALHSMGIHWLPRRRVPRYSVHQRRTRRAFAAAVAAMSPAAVKRKLALAMDGVILARPPADPIDRENFVKHGDTHCYRTHAERASPALDGGNHYGAQVSLDRAVPLWGGLAAGGFAVVAFHPRKKLKKEEWAKIVHAGKLVSAIRCVNPTNPCGPWHVLCDNERFLDARSSKAAHRAANVKLWHIPPKSPDLNPVERFWGWLRRALLQLDMQDLEAGRPVPARAAYRQRIRQLLASQRARRAAANYAASFRKTCIIVRDNGGKHSGK